MVHGFRKFISKVFVNGKFPKKLPSENFLLYGICDWIWENVYSSHIRFCSFGDPQKSQGMVYRFETIRNNKRIVVLQSLNDSHLSVIPNKFYESPKLKHWMCELCTFSQIRSHIHICHNLLYN